MCLNIGSIPKLGSIFYGMMDELFEIVKFRWGFQDEDDDGELVGGLEHEFIFPYLECQTFRRFTL